jgi:hypothetical protein
MKQFVESFEDMEKLVNTLKETDKYVIDIEQPPDEFGYIVRWVETAQYTAMDGKSYAEEVWVTRDGDMFNIKDLSEDHCRNIIRMLIRQQRDAYAEVDKIIEETVKSLGVAIDDIDHIPEARVLH